MHRLIKPISYKALKKVGELNGSQIQAVLLAPVLRMEFAELA